MDIKDLSQFTRTIPLFSIFTDEELAELMSSAELKSLSAGEVVFSQGDPGDRFYIVYSGRVRILQKRDEQAEVNLGVRLKGDHFGEAALVTDKPRNATARASEDTILISMDREAFQRHFLNRPELRDFFDKFIRYTSIHRFLRSCTALSAVSPAELQELARHFKPEHFKEGETVFLQDAEPDKFFLVESGKLKVVRWEDGRPEVINFLREGDFFGEKALLEDTRRFADVVCLTDCHLFSMHKSAFQGLVAKSPKIKRIVEDRIKSYLMEKPPIPYQEMIRQELSALKEITVKEDPPPSGTEAGKRAGRLRSFYRQHVAFPLIRQHDQMTCGTTCIMMIAKYYGKTFSSNRVRDLAHVDLSGASLADLASAAEQLGFSTRGMKLDYQTLGSVPLPCMVHWQGYHYIVVYRMDHSHVWVADPAIGLRRYKKDYFVENWNGITLTLEPTPELEKQEESPSSIKSFLQFVTPHRGILIEIFLASLLLNIFGLATPIFTQNIVDKVLIHQNVSLLNIMLIGMLIVLLFRVLTMIVRQYLVIHTSMKIDLKMLVFFYKHLLALPLGYFRVRKIGDFITRFNENLKIRNFLTNTALTIVLDGVLIVVYLSLMAYYNLRLTLLVTAFIPLFAIMTLLFTPVLKRLNIDSFSARADSQSHLIESINGIDTVKALNLEYPIRWKWEGKFIKSLNIDFRLFNTAMHFQCTGDFIATLSSSVILWYGAHSVMEGDMSVGQLMAFMSLMGSVVTPINRIITAWDDIQETSVSVSRLNDVFSARPEFPESADQEAGIVLREPRGEITFEKVFFRYGGEDDPYILSNINMKVLPGQKVAIVGRSGSGKTTLVKLVSRFYDVTEGKILFDGYEIRNVSLSSLRKLIGFVLQESFLFNGTIRENISLGDPGESVERVMEAAKLANAHDFISNLGTGYETRVGESGLQLSGGQKQRIAIARVLYSNPKVLILDEATSSLDTESEQAIQKNLHAILKDRTALIIAHRLSTVRNADYIYVLDKGEIVEHGTHEALIEQQGLYHYLNHQQLNL